MSTKPTPQKTGRVPLTSAIKAEDFAPYNADDNLLRLDPTLKAQLDSEGFAIRWINKRKYMESGNYHPRGWQAYRIDPSATRAALDFKFGISPEGFLERDGNLLAVKPKEHQEAHARKIAERSRVQTGEYKRKAERLKEDARRQGIEIDDGYDD